MQPNIVLIDGDYWPAADVECRPAIMKTYRDADFAMAYCQQKKVAIQAGGNCGIWARYLADHFDHVYTFEPDITNFLCLNLNVPNDNVIRMQAALGIKNGPVSVYKADNNVGAHFTSIAGGTIPQIRIDDLRLPSCDLIQLDVEGFEYFALRGAKKTILKHRPVLMLEDKGHGRRHGLNPDCIIKFMAECSYVLKEKINRDMIWVHVKCA